MTKLQTFLNSPISAIAPMNAAPKAGDLFGIELECEGKNVDWDATPDIMNTWSPHRDGSLRNNHGQACEWVFNGPATYQKSQERVNILFDYFTKRKSKLVTSNRTSTHIHFNMGDKNVYQLINLFILFTILEDLLDRYCGDDRRGNLFCLSSRHAEEQVQWVSDACFHKFNWVIDDNKRYCSLNLAAINKFGTVEFRGMRGLDNREDMLAWLSIVQELCDYACYKMKNPVDIIEQISVQSPRGLLQAVFSEENVQRLTSGITENELHDSVYDGLRLVQMLCYRIGTEFDGVKLKGKDFWASFEHEVKAKEPPQPALRPFGREIGNRARIGLLDPQIGAVLEAERERLRRRFINIAPPGAAPIIEEELNDEF